jgi:hypothetical protein
MLASCAELIRRRFKDLLQPKRQGSFYGILNDEAHVISDRVNVIALADAEVLKNNSRRGYSGVFRDCVVFRHVERLPVLSRRRATARHRGDGQEGTVARAW